MGSEMCIRDRSNPHNVWDSAKVPGFKCGQALDSNIVTIVQASPCDDWIIASVTVRNFGVGQLLLSSIHPCLAVI